MNLFSNIIESYRDWQYTRLYRKHRKLTREIELRQFAKDNVVVNDDNQAESFIAFLDRRIDLSIKRRDKVSVKLSKIYESWKA